MHCENQNNRSTVVRDADTGDKIFEIWVNNDSMVILHIYVTDQELPYEFDMDTAQAENLITALNIALEME